MTDIGDTLTLSANDGTVVNPTVVDYIDYGEFNGRKYYGYAYTEEALDYFAGEIRSHVGMLFDCIIMITGEERAGKSTYAIKLARKITHDTMELKFITFKIEEFNKAIEEATQGQVIIMDEAGHDLFALEWWNEFQIELVKKLQVIAKKQLILIMVLPHRNDLNRRIRERRVNYWVHVYLRNDEERGWAEVRKAVKNKWEQSIFWEPFLTHKFSKEHDIFWTNYEVKKDAFINEVASQSYEAGGSKRSSKAMESRDKLLYLIISNGWATQTYLANYIGLSQNRISEIYKRTNEEIARGENNGTVHQEI